MLKYQVFLDSLRAQIWKHTYHSLGPAKYYVFLDSLRPQIRELKYCNSMTAALYYAGVELVKYNIQRTFRLMDRQRKQIQRPLQSRGSPG